MTFSSSSARSFCLALFITLALSSLSSTTSAQTLSSPLKPDILSNKSYTEVYTLTAHADDSTFVQVMFTITNLGIEDRNAACTALIFHPSKKAWKANEKFTSKQWPIRDAQPDAASAPAPSPCFPTGSAFARPWEG